MNYYFIGVDETLIVNAVIYGRNSDSDSWETLTDIETEEEILLCEEVK